ncbi:MAG: hypothetical protein ACFE0O_15785 [Opitutales bacterium]
MKTLKYFLVAFAFLTQAIPVHAIKMEVIFAGRRGVSEEFRNAVTSYYKAIETKNFKDTVNKTLGTRTKSAHKLYYDKSLAWFLSSQTIFLLGLENVRVEGYDKAFVVFGVFQDIDGHTIYSSESSEHQSSSSYRNNAFTHFWLFEEGVWVIAHSQLLNYNPSDRVYEINHKLYHKGLVSIDSFKNRLSSDVNWFIGFHANKEEKASSIKSLTRDSFKKLKTVKEGPKSTSESP